MEKRHGYAVIVNNDLTEGKGENVILHICEHQVTAERLAKGKDVQGSDGTVVKVELVSHPDGSRWGKYYGPIDLIPGTREDLQYEQQLEIWEIVMQRAIEKGLTRKEVELLMFGGGQEKSFSLQKVLQRRLDDLFKSIKVSEIEKEVIGE